MATSSMWGVAKKKAKKEDKSIYKYLIHLNKQYSWSKAPLQLKMYLVGYVNEDTDDYKELSKRALEHQYG